MTTTGRAYIRTIRSVASVLDPNHTPVIKEFMNILSLLNSLPFTWTLLYIPCLIPNRAEKLICRLSSCFSILWPLNKTLCSLLAVQIQAEKEPSRLRQGASAWARTLARVQATNLLTVRSCMCNVACSYFEKINLVTNCKRHQITHMVHLI